MPFMGVVYELLTMFKISRGDQSVRLTGGRVATTDDRYRVYSAGVTIERPHDVRGDAVNELCIGARLDSLTEALAARRAQADRAAVAEQQADILDAQAVNDVPVVGLKTEPVSV